MYNIYGFCFIVIQYNILCYCYAGIVLTDNPVLFVKETKKSCKIIKMPH